MKKVILIIAGIFVVLLVGGGLYFWDMTQKPLYEPGMVRTEKNLAAPLTPPAQTQNAETWLVEPGIKLHHFSDGNGEKVLVIHGGPGSPFVSPAAGLHELADQYEFNYYDQRGCGGSTRPIDRFESSNMYQNMLTLDKTLGLGAQIADIERIRQILGEDKIILVGHSFGGFLAALYAAEFPEHVKAMVLVAPAEMLVMPQEDGGLFETIKPYLSEAQKTEYESFMKRYLDFGTIFNYSDAELAALNGEFGRYYSEAAAAKGLSMPEGEAGAAGGWMVWGMYVSMGQKHDYRSALKVIQSPTLVIHGSNDFQSDQASRLYTKVIPGAQFEVIPGAGHFVFNDQPDAFAGVVGKFLSEVK